ncbi:hypothetical protein SPD48_10415 [Pseudogracilibacillus sp. SE30717A]|uniref:hypothetical protein n=1 Tax=Pseudogracilibacillus sp. SE30717A TaxID=3098293 RepID=UPI00300E39A9
MKVFSTWGLRLSITLYTLLHFFTAFFNNKFALSALAIAGLALFFFSLLYLSIQKFKLPFTIFICGILILLFSDHSVLNGILQGLILMKDMIGLLIIVPLIGWVLREEPYIEDIMSVFYTFINTSQKFYLSLITFTQIIAYFLLFGSIPMMYQFVNIILKDHHTEFWEKYKGTALLRGFALSTLWVVSIPSFIFAVEALGASLWLAILQGLGIAIIGTILAVTFAFFSEKRSGFSITPTLQQNIKLVLVNASPKEIRKKKVIEFFLLFISLFGSIFLIHGVFRIPLMLIIPLVIVGWICAFFLFKRRGYKLTRVAKEYVRKDMINQSYQLNIMLSVGVLIFALRQTGFAPTIVNSLHFLQDTIPFINPLFLLPFIVIILGFFGLGPLTVMVLVAGILSGMELPYSPELIVLSITSGSVISILISPVIMPVIALSASNGLSMFTNGIKFNWKYAIVFYIIVQTYIQIMVHV